MSKIFIIGSTDGLGFLAAQKLIKTGHEVVVHARNSARAEQVRQKLPKVSSVLIADLTNTKETKQLAEAANALGYFDAIIHNAGVYRASGEEILAVNTLAPYILTCMMKKPQRLIYLSSGMHKQGNPSLDKIKSGGPISYSDSKLHVVLLAKAVARKWPEVYVNAVDPGWVPTKMGGSGAPDDLDKGYETQVWLAASDDEKAKVSGRYFYHKKEAMYQSIADNTELQEEFFDICKEVTNVALKG